MNAHKYYHHTILTIPPIYKSCLINTNLCSCALIKYHKMRYIGVQMSKATSTITYVCVCVWGGGGGSRGTKVSYTLNRPHHTGDIISTTRTNNG